VLKTHSSYFPGQTLYPTTPPPLFATLCFFNEAHCARRLVRYFWNFVQLFFLLGSKGVASVNGRCVPLITVADFLECESALFPSQRDPVLHTATSFPKASAAVVTHLLQKKARMFANCSAHTSVSLKAFCSRRVRAQLGFFQRERDNFFCIAYILRRWCAAGVISTCEPQMCVCVCVWWGGGLSVLKNHKIKVCSLVSSSETRHLFLLFLFCFPSSFFSSSPPQYLISCCHGAEVPFEQVTKFLFFFTLESNITDDLASALFLPRRSLRAARTYF